MIKGLWMKGTIDNMNIRLYGTNLKQFFLPFLKGTFFTNIINHVSVPSLAVVLILQRLTVSVPCRIGPMY